MDPTAFHIEDDLESTTTVEKTLQELNVNTLVAHSTAAAWPIAESGQFGFALIDQKLPVEDDGAKAASEQQVYELACRVGQKAPFVWLTAHVLSARYMEIPNCIGCIQKAGEVEEEVLLHTHEAFPDLRAHIYLDEVMVELKNTGGTSFQARVLPWKPDYEFQIPGNYLDAWVASEVVANGRQYFRARAWLGAERPGQLDLSDWKPMPQPKSTPPLWDN